MIENSTPTSPAPAHDSDTANPPSNLYAPAPTAVPARRGLAITSLILGVVALLGSAVPVLNVISALIAVVGLALGIVALVKRQPKGLSLSGTIVSAVALLVSLVLAVVYAIGLAAAIEGASSGVSGSVDEPVSVGEPAAEPAEEPAAGAEGTRDNPAPLGTTVVLSEGGEDTYEITLGPATLNANEAVAAANQFNEAPPAGFQYAVLPVAVTYIGSETGTPWIDLTIEFVSASGTTHTQSDSLVVGPSPDIFEINELYPGASGSGNITIMIPTDNAEAGTWTVSSLFVEPYFFTAQ